MKNSVIAIILVFIAVFTACNNNSGAPKDTVKTTLLKEDLIKRGEYLVQITGCNDCHSPKRMGANGPEIIPELMLSGYSSKTPLPKTDKTFLTAGFAAFSPDLTAAAGPWGISFAGNITSDATGIGGWTEEQFKKALTQGKFKGQDGGRMLLPPMPWINYTKMSDEDLKAIFTYLQSVKGVNNVVPLPVAPDKI